MGRFRPRIGGYFLSKTLYEILPAHSVRESFRPRIGGYFLSTIKKMEYESLLQQRFRPRIGGYFLSLSISQLQTYIKK